MNWDAIGAVSEVLGALVVVVTLLYLSKEIGQTNRIAKAAVGRELQEKYAVVYSMLATNREIQDLVARLSDPDYEVQSKQEQEQIEGFGTLLLGIWLTTGVAYEQGQIDIKQYNVYRDDINVKLSKWPGLRPHLKRIMDSYPDAGEFEIFRDLYD